MLLTDWSVSQANPPPNQSQLQRLITPGHYRLPAATKALPGASLIIVNTSSFAIELPELLIARLKRRDLDAFEQVYRSFNRPVYTLALRLLGNETEAFDLLQDSFLKVFEQIAQYRSEAPFWSWLRSIVVNAALMRLRGRRPLDELDSLMLEHMADSGPDPFDAVSGQDLKRAMAQLPALSRAVLWLYHVEGYTHEEIAVAFERTVSFSKSQVARASARLRSLLNQEDAQWNPASIPA
jgi:RNA polymerase sigma factor (sigma-70 family)